MEQTLVLIKPDAVAAGHVGNILGRYERAELTLKAIQMRTITPEFADQHYSDHVGRDYYPPLRDFMTEGPLVAAIVAGKDAIAKVREIHGATDPSKADPGTVRADLAESIRRNAVHASDSLTSAEREVQLWFG